MALRSAALALATRGTLPSRSVTPGSRGVLTPKPKLVLLPPLGPEPKSVTQETAPPAAQTPIIMGGAGRHFNDPLDWMFDQGVKTEVWQSFAETVVSTGTVRSTVTVSKISTVVEVSAIVTEVDTGSISTLVEMINPVTKIRIK